MIVTIPLQEGRQFRIGEPHPRGADRVQARIAQQAVRDEDGQGLQLRQDRAGQRGGAHALPLPWLHLCVHGSRAHRAEGRDAGCRRQGPRHRGRPLSPRKARVLRQHQDAGPGAAARAAPVRGRLDGHEHPQALGVQGQPARLLQAQGRSAGVQVRRGWQAGRSDREGRRGGPHRHPVRRRLLGAGRVVRPIHVQHPQLPRTRRDAWPLGLVWQARVQLLAVVLRALLHGSPDGHRGLDLQAGAEPRRDGLRAAVLQGIQGRLSRLGSGGW